LKKSFGKIRFAAILTGLSVFFYWLQNTIFHQPDQSGFYFFQDMAFLPLQVLLVTLILDGIMKEREKRERLDQNNIVVVAFFSEQRSDAIRRIKPFITNSDGIADRLDIGGRYSSGDFKDAADAVMNYPFQADSRAGDLKETGDYLYSKKSIVLGMFENPNLLENSRFTSMLWAVYHVMDELKNREDFSSLPKSDLDHLSGDIERAYRLLVVEWVFYMRHLKEKYPYLFSLAVRKSPFTPSDSVIIC
jgi:hypothetical protein